MNRDVCEHFNPVDLPCEKCKQPEALFLATELESLLGIVISGEVDRRAAAELRRLHAQRDALLEALRMIRVKYGEYACRVCDNADAAIKAAEENT